MLAVGNLSCSLHGIRSRRRSLPPPTRSSSSPPITSCAQLSQSRPEGTWDCQVSPTGTGAGTGDLLPRPRLRCLCDGALRLTTKEPDHAAGSAVRALGYLAWGLDPDSFGDGGGWGGTGGERHSGGGAGNNGVVEARATDNESAVSLLPVGGDEDDAVASGPTVEAAAESGEEDGGDRDLQDKAILALSKRLTPDNKGDLELGNDGAGGGGGAWGGGGSGSGDRRAEIAAAKCRSDLLVCFGGRGVPWYQSTAD